MSDNTPARTTGQKVADLVDTAKAKAGPAVAYARRRPYLAGFVALACLGLGYYLTRDKTPSLASIAPTPGYAAPALGQPGGQPMKLAVTDKKAEAAFTVASARVTNGPNGAKLLLNDNRDFRLARQTVVIDLAKFPQFAPPGGNATGYIGKHVTAKGTLATYDGRPQVILDQAEDCTVK